MAFHKKSRHRKPSQKQLAALRKGRSKLRKKRKLEGKRAGVKGLRKNLSF